MRFFHCLPALLAPFWVVFPASAEEAGTEGTATRAPGEIDIVRDSDPAPPAVSPGDGATAAGELVGLLDQRIATATARRDAVAVDLGVLNEVGSLEGQLTAARLDAERQRLEKTINTLGAARSAASAAATDFGVCGKGEAVASTYTGLREAADRARKKVARYRSDRETRIATVEAGAPVVIDGIPLAQQVEDFMTVEMAAMDPTRKADFLGLIYTVAAELGVRVPQKLDNGDTVLNDYSAVLQRSPRAEAQMAVLALVAYRNRQGQGIGGTILGAPMEELISSRAITAPRGRTYQITDVGRENQLLKPVRGAWGTPEIVVGSWDLTKGARTSAAMKRFASGEAAVADAGLLGTLAEVEQMISSARRQDAIEGEMGRLHADALGRAKKHDLDMESHASAVFQADALEKRREKSMADIGSASEFFVDEAARLSGDAAATPRVADVRRHARLLHEATIGLRRAQSLTRALADR